MLILGAHTACLTDVIMYVMFVYMHLPKDTCMVS